MRKPRKFSDAIDPLSKDFQIHEWPFYGIIRLAGRYHLRLDAVLKPIKMDVPRWRVLMTLSRHGAMTITAIADEAVVKISTMAKIVQRMAAQGLVETRISTSDARSIEVSITADGRRTLETIRAKVARVSNKAFDGLSETDLRSLNAMTRMIHDNLSA